MWTPTSLVLIGIVVAALLYIIASEAAAWVVRLRRRRGMDDTSIGHSPSPIIADQRSFERGRDAAAKMVAALQNLS